MTFFTSYNYEGAATRIMNKLVSTFKPCGKDKDTGTHFITQSTVDAFGAHTITLCPYLKK